jgi:hypothetical protein
MAPPHPAASAGRSRGTTPARPGAEALAEVVRADRPRQPAQRPLVAHHHPAHRPFRSTIQSPCNDRLRSPRCVSHRRRRPRSPGRRPARVASARRQNRRRHRWSPLTSGDPGGSGASARRACLPGSQVGGLRSLFVPVRCRTRRPGPPARSCSPLACTALMCTNTSSPCSGRMKP